MITYIHGDATNPQGDGKKIIVHIVNDLKIWGRGFVLALSKKWKTPEETYRRTNLQDIVLGTIQLAICTDDITVVNMVAQHGIDHNIYGAPPVRYEALRDCLSQVNAEAIRIGATIHMPRIGCGLAGGSWTIVEKIINETLLVNVFVYDLQGKDVFGAPIFKH
jgi:O-acetyl-ADP-ribose deacetylase (regulator of RNase III)